MLCEIHKTSDLINVSLLSVSNKSFTESGIFKIRISNIELESSLASIICEEFHVLKNSNIEKYYGILFLQFQHIITFNIDQIVIATHKHGKVTVDYV